MKTLSQLLYIDVGIQVIPIRMSVVLGTSHSPVIRCYSANIAFHITLACHFVRAAWRHLESTCLCALSSLSAFQNSLLYRNHNIWLLVCPLCYPLSICHQLHYTNGFPQIDSVMSKIISLLLYYVCFAQWTVRDN